MYLRWAKAKRLNAEILDTQTDAKSKAGLRSVTLRVDGEGAARLLGETGAHCIQHITRSRKADRIHTSMVSVVAYPAPAPSEPVTLDQREIRVDTFRGTGNGGQHRNVTDSAVRAVHLPTGTVATVTSGRSQQQNRETALRVLQARLQAQADSVTAQALAQARGGGRSGRSGAVRVYDEVRDMVRCPQTGQKLKGVSAVFDGGLDSLL